MERAPDDVSSMLEVVFNVGRSSRHGLRRRRIFGAFAAKSGILASPSTVTGAAEAARRARRLRLAGRDCEAAAGFERALSLDPACAQALAWRWESRWTRGSSFSDIERAMRLEPEEPVWRIWRGLAGLARYEGRQPAAEAKRFFAEALALRASPLAWAGLALAEFRSGRFGAAAAAATKALEGEPGQGWLHRLRAGARLRGGDEAGFLADCRAETLLDEGVGMLAEVFPTADRRPAPRLLAAAERFLARRPNAHWMLVVSGDCRRSPEINDFAGAVSDFERAAALKPDCAFTRAYLSRALMVGGRTGEALKAIDRAVRLAPGSGWLRVWRGELKRRLGEHSAALADFDAGLRLDPDYEMGYAWRGGARRSLGRTAGALEDLDLAAALDPNYAWTFAERSLTQRALGRTAAALGDLEAAVRLDSKYAWSARAEPAAVAALDAEIKASPRNAWAWAWRGETKLRLSDAAGAARDLRKAAALNPRLGWPRVWLGQALLRLGRPKEALAAFDRGVALDPSYPPALAERGRLRLRLGKVRAAWSDLSRAAAAGPLAARIWQSKGEAGLRLGRWAEAVSDFSKALELERGWRPRLGRSAAYERLGRQEKARADLAVPLTEARRLAEDGRGADAAMLCAEALALHPRSAAFQAELLRHLGAFGDAVAAGAPPAPPPDAAWAPAPSWTFAWRGALARREERWRDARAALDRAVALDPDCFWARAWAGELRLARGEAAAALPLLLESVRLYPAWADSQCWRGRALCALGRCAEAQSAFKAALKADRRHVWTWIASGICSERRGRAAEARRALQRARSLAPALFQG